MFPEERQQKICDLVNERRSIKVSELSKLIHISEVTIRRDLVELAKKKRLVRTHGGAIAIYSVGAEVSAPELILSNKNAVAKRDIAEVAYATISDKDTILMDGSSTVYELLKLIIEGEKRDLIIITTSFTMLNAMADLDHVKAIMLGGEVNFFHSHVEGYITASAIKNLRADKCFIGINGIDEAFGLSTPRFPEAEMKEEMIASSIQSYVLADKSKFGKVYLAKVDAFCDYIITDTQMPDYSYDWLPESCTVLFADEAE